MNRSKYLVMMSTLLALMFVLIPVGAFAFPGDGGNQGLTGADPGQYEIDNQTVLVFVTGNSGSVSRTSGSDSDRTQVYTAYPEEGWEFAGWWTYYAGPVTEGSNYEFGLIDPAWAFSKPGASDQKYEKPAASIQINNELTAVGTYYLYAVYKPIVAINSDVASTVYVRSSGYATDWDGNFSTTVGYEDDAQFGICLSNNVPVKIMENHLEVLDHTVKSSETGTTWVYINRKITRPTTISVTSRPKKQVVKFDANGGMGTMASQEFDYDVTGTLNAPAFQRTGYYMTGWNTRADGSGTEYTLDGSHRFLPESDGEEVTLYAQWAEHTSHVGGSATCNEKAICSECGASYGDVSHDNHVGERELRGAAEPGEFIEGYTGDVYCLGCGNVTEYGEAIPMTHTHHHEDKFNEAEHWLACACGDEQERARHSFGQWSVVTDADVNAVGLRERSCNGCDYIEQEEISALKPPIQDGGTGGSDSNVPETGDDSNLMFWLALSTAALALALAAALRGNRRHNN